MRNARMAPGDFPYPITGESEESRYLTWLRNHSNYLAPRGFLDYLRALAVLLRGVLINLLVVLPLLLFAALALSAWHDERLDAWAVDDHSMGSSFVLTPWVAAAALLWFLAFPLVIRLFKVRQHRQSIDSGIESSVKQRDRYERSFGAALLIVAGVAAVEAAPLAIHVFHDLRLGGWRDVVAGVAAASSAWIVSVAGQILDRLGAARKVLAMWTIGLIGGLLPLLVVLYVAEDLVYPEDGIIEPQWGLLLGIVAALAGGTLVAFVASVRRVGVGQSWFVLSLLGLVLVVGAAVGLAGTLDETSTLDPDWMFIVSLAVVLWLFSWLSVDVNLTSLNGFYRDRLAAAYLVGQDTSGDVDIEEDVNLMDICRHEEGSTAPYHLVNVALNLQGSSDISIRDRNSDFFIFSKRYIGGQRTGFCRTEDLESVFPQMDLATAMAISAAAAAPNMGTATTPPLVAIMTLFNVRLGYWIPNPGRLSAWMGRMGLGGTTPSEPTRFDTVFETERAEVEARWRNVYPADDGEDSTAPRRLAPTSGPTPDHGLVGLGFSGGGIRSATVNLGIVQTLHQAGVFDHVDYLSTVSGGGYLGSSISTLMRTRRKGLDPPPAHPALTLANRFRWRVRPRAFLREVSSRLDERYDWVNLSDGGHIENLATIELLRRRCRFIITGDAEADPDLQFGSLAALLRYARIDLGIEIDLALHAVRRSIDIEIEPVHRMSEQHFAVGRITYPGERTPGVLLYFKSTLTGDEPEDVRAYRAQHLEFPHESTADQFFDEGQFEAYRALGEHMARSALAVDAGDKTSYEGLVRWFDALVHQRGDAVADYYFALRVTIDINKYPSGAALLDRWLEEADAAEGAEQAGVIQVAWKDVNEPVVYPVLRIEADDPLQAHAAVLEALKACRWARTAR